MNWHSIRSNHCVFLENMKGYSHLDHFDDGGLVAELNIRARIPFMLILNCIQSQNGKTLCQLVLFLSKPINQVSTAVMPSAKLMC